jgi:hypothetical protein
MTVDLRQRSFANVVLKLFSMVARRKHPQWREGLIIQRSRGLVRVLLVRKHMHPRGLLSEGEEEVIDVAGLSLGTPREVNARISARLGAEHRRPQDARSAPRRSRGNPGAVPRCAVRGSAPVPEALRERQKTETEILARRIFL